MILTTKLKYKMKKKANIANKESLLVAWAIGNGIQNENSNIFKQTQMKNQQKIWEKEAQVCKNDINLIAKRENLLPNESFIRVAQSFQIFRILRTLRYEQSRFKFRNYGFKSGL